MEAPETRHAQSGDVSIAFKVVGEGAFDLVCTPPGSRSRSAPVASGTAELKGVPGEWRLFAVESV